MASPKRKGWFERNQGLITFLGYLTTVIIGGVSMYISNSKSTDAIKLSNDALKLNKDQFHYQVSKDSANSIKLNLADSIAMVRIHRQDSLNKHQDSVNNEQLKNFISQTFTAKEQLKYFKRQTLIAETQLKNAEIIYQQQLDANKPSFVLQEFTLDTPKNQKEYFLKFNIYNIGKRTAFIKKLNAFLWNSGNDYLNYNIVSVGGDGLMPSTKSSSSLHLDLHLEINLQTIILIQIFYQDELSRDIKLFRVFTRFDALKPLLNVQVDEELQIKLLKRIEKAEITENKKFLTF